MSAPRDASSRSRWLSMRRACEILGVNAATLRQWTSEGKVPAYVTPGGHRRYDESTLRALVDRGSLGAAEVPRPPLLASHDQYQAVRALLDAERWYQLLDNSARQQFRILGHGMLHLLGTYVLATSERERQVSLAQAREVATQHGSTAAAAGLSSRDAMGAFLVFRAPILDTLADWSSRRAADGVDLAEMLRRVIVFMDDVMLTMVASHEQAARAPQGPPS